MFDPCHAASASRRPRAAATALGTALLLCLAAIAPLAAQANVGRTVVYDSPGHYAFAVPAGVTSLSVTAVGAAGGDNCAAAGGRGAKLAATVPVVPGDLLLATVGEAGSDRVCNVNEDPSVDSLGGGARGGTGGIYLGGSAGGGATSLRQLAFPVDSGVASLVVAAGGGGAAQSQDPAFGFGGDAGQAGGVGEPQGFEGHGGLPGGPSGGGAGGAGEPNCIGGGLGETGAAGVLGAGGHGGDFPGIAGGGGGGGGLYGGGGGGGGCRAGGGGGGSSFVLPAGTVAEAAAPSTEDARITLVYPAPAATITAAPGAFPVVAQGTVSAPQAVEIANTGEAPLIVGGASFAGEDPGDFLIGASSCGSPVEPGDSCRMQVRFAPQAEGPRTATLLVAVNDADAPAAIALSGTGGALPAGPAGARGPAGRVALITCKPRRAGHGASQRCRSKLAPVAFALAGRRTVAVLSRGSKLYAKGFATRSLGGGRQLVMTPLRTLRPGRYKLRLGRGGGLHRETILIAGRKPS